MNQHDTPITLEQTIALLEKAQEVAHIGSWVAELNDSDLLVWSRETFRIFGADPENFHGTSATFFSFVHPDDLGAVNRASNAARGGEAPYDIEHRIVRADGEVRWVHERADIAYDANGRPRQMVGTVQDITERRLLEEQVRQSQKLEAVGRLAGGIAHDLNNSLTAVIGYAELAIGALAGSHPAHADVQEIRRAAARAESVTRQLLAFSRKQMLEPRVFSLADSIRNLTRMIEHALGSAITYTAEMPAQIPAIYGDPGQLEQAILNIVLNARDAMPTGGTLTLSLADVTVDETFALGHQPMLAGRYVRVRAVDSGHGMDAATRARVFEPFFTTKDVGKGTGLGLAMVYGTIRQSGGYIFVESEPGQGAVFTMYFVPATGEVRAPVRPNTRHAGVATILVVEDDPAVRRLVTTSLRKKGHRILHAASAGEAIDLAAVETKPIDLLLTDASMPGMTGIDLARTLAPARPDMRIVVMSGFTEQTLKLREAGLPAVLLPKPFSPAELQRIIAGVLAGDSPDRV